ncbi:hypothetical protein ACJX0J_011802, partial [Zea mays]
MTTILERRESTSSHDLSRVATHMTTAQKDWIRIFRPIKTEFSITFGDNGKSKVQGPKNFNLFSIHEIASVDGLNLYDEHNIGGNKYGFIIMDDFPRYIWYELKIKKVRSDNESEINHELLAKYILSEYSVIDILSFTLDKAKHIDTSNCDCLFL